MTALAAQVVWTRILSLLIGATTYTFSLILAVFLAGLGIGSSIGAALAPQPEAAAHRARLVSAVCCAPRWAGPAYLLNGVVPVLADQPVDSRPISWYLFQLDLFRCALAVLPGAILWGATFPLALASVARPDEDPGPAGRWSLRGQHARRHRRRAGGEHAARCAGRQPAHAADAHRRRRPVGAAAALAREGQHARLRRRHRARRDRWRSAYRRCRACSSPTAATPRPSSGPVSPRSSTWAKGGTRRSPCPSGRTASATITTPARSRRRASRRTCASSGCSGHLTTLVPAKAETVLVIGCGAGVTAGAVSIEPTLEAGDHRRDRAARADCGARLHGRAQLRRRQEPEGADRRWTTRGTS